MLFDRWSIETSFMCHPGRVCATLKKPSGWKILFMECGQCRKAKEIVTLHTLAPPPIKIWMCVGCELMHPDDLRDIITDPSMSMKNPQPYSLPHTFVSKGDK